jgi:DnaK suppressor protein
LSEQDEPTREALRRARADAEAQVSALSDDLRGVIEASRSSNADDEHDPEGSTIAFERSQVGTLVEDARHQLAEVDAARARLADGTYGTCAECGGPIGEGRLEARPTARTCIRCAASAS